MVSTEASLPAVGLLMVVLLLNDFSPARGASRQEAGPAKQTAQRVLARHAQSEIRPETLPLSLRECIALALERNFDIRIEGFNPKIRTADVVNERAEFDPSLFAGYLFSGGKEQLDDAPIRFPPNGAAKVETSTPLVGVEQRLQTGTRFALQLNQQHITSNETNSTARVVNPSNEVRTILSLTQPILRNLGLDVNRTRIRIAETNRHFQYLL